MRQAETLLASILPCAVYLRVDRGNPIVIVIVVLSTPRRSFAQHGLLYMVLRGIPVDDVGRQSAHGGHHARVTFPLWPPRRVVHPCTDPWLPRNLLWTGDRKTDILRDRRRRRAPRNLDIPQNASQTWVW
jgi:hypothetical protein